MRIGRKSAREHIWIDGEGRLDRVSYGRARGVAGSTVLLNAGANRVRPIIMTTLARVAGMVPVVLGLSPDASFRAPMAVTVIGGLLASTVLSLFFVPVIYMAFDGLRRPSTAFDGLRRPSTASGPGSDGGRENF